LIYQVVLATFIADAIPYPASVLVPDVLLPVKYIVSLQAIDIVTLGAVANAITVPIGYATLLFAGIVTVAVAVR
jgi:hypothetical protein